MPCRTDPPSDGEVATWKTDALVCEIRGLRYIPSDKQPNEPFTNIQLEGMESRLQVNTRELCEWCQAHPAKVKHMSLELQIWWRDHQRADARHAAEDRARHETARLRKQALAKLTPAERKALGVTLR